MKNNTKGFSIIEVVLVLAIAGLIFLAVFIALPALQRGQRDTQRRSDMSTFVAQLQQYATNNKGKLPSSQAQLNTFGTNYLKWVAPADPAPADPGELLDPKTGLAYTLTYTTGTATSSASNVIMYHYKSKCNGESVTTGQGIREAAITLKLEGSGVFCKDLSS